MDSRLSFDTVHDLCGGEHALYRKERNAEPLITEKNDGAIENELFTTDSEDQNSVDVEFIDQERVCLLDG